MPAERRQAVGHAIEAHGYSERRACLLVRVNRRTFRRQPLPDPNAELRERLRALAEQRRSFGSPRLHLMLCREGWAVNHKRVERIYREEGLSLRLKRRRKRPSHLRVVHPGPSGPNQQWALDFMSDSLVNGGHIRLLTIVDLWDRHCPGIEVDRSLTGARVVRVLESLRLASHCPAVLRLDNGPEFTGKALDCWAHEHGVRLDFTRPGKPTDNGHIESFNGRLRQECLDQNLFHSSACARRIVETWRQDYNRNRPHSSLGGLTPDEFRAANFKPSAECKTTNSSVVYPAG